MAFLFLSQNALPSDEDDKDPSDPHKALDIDLDKLVLSFFRPLRSLFLSAHILCSKHV